MNKLISLILFFHFPLLSAQGLAPPFSLSQGGAGGASLKEDLSYLINPAIIGFQKRTKGAIYYSFQENKHTALASFLDLKSRIPLALTYQRFWSQSFKESEGEKVFFSSGLKISPYFSLGVTVEKNLEFSTFNANIGSLLSISRQLSLALFMDRILKKEGKNERVISLAGYYDWKDFFISRLDISRTTRKEWILKGGLESFFQNFLSLRLGAHWNHKTNETVLSGGVAFSSPKLQVEYGIQKEEKSYQHSAALILRI